MNPSDLIGGLLKTGGPILASIVGGPAGAVASLVVSALAEAFGTDPTPEAVKDAIATNPDAAKIIRQVEADRAAGFVDLLNAEIADVQNARAMNAANVSSQSAQAVVPQVQTYVITGAFIALIAALIFKQVPDSNIVMILFGALSAEFARVNGFWFGTTASSARNGEAMRTLAATAQSPAAAVVSAVAKAVKK